jgi:hypothetical protein
MLLCVIHTGSSDEQLRLLETAGDDTQEFLMGAGGSGALSLATGSASESSGGALSKNAQMVIRWAFGDGLVGLVVQSELYSDARL